MPFVLMDLHSQILDVPGQIFFIFMQFSEKFGRIINWRYPHAADLSFFCFKSELEFVKSVKGKSDHGYDFSYPTSSNRPQVVMTGK